MRWLRSLLSVAAVETLGDVDFEVIFGQDRNEVHLSYSTLNSNMHVNRNIYISSNFSFTDPTIHLSRRKIIHRHQICLIILRVVAMLHRITLREHDPALPRPAGV